MPRRREARRTPVRAVRHWQSAAQGSMPGELFRHQRRALAFMLQRERGAGGGPAGGILADDQVPAAIAQLQRAC